MKIFITGANGFLGQHLAKYLSDKGFEVIASGKGMCRNSSKGFPFYESMDLTEEEILIKIIKKHRPEIVIHTAAMSKPDECNNNKAGCLLNNVEATRYLVNAARPFSTQFIYTSTDFIFGENGPHEEDELPDPLNFYGESKLMAEEIVKQSGLLYGIVRPVFIYGPVWEGMRPSFLHWVKNNLEAHKNIKVVCDQYRTPTYVYDICKGIESIITRRAAGEFHLAGKEIVSPYQMAITVAETLGLDASLIESVNSDTFPEPVKRAKRSGLKIAKAIRELDYSPVSFEEGVKLTFNDNNK